VNQVLSADYDVADSYLRIVSDRDSEQSGDYIFTATEEDKAAWLREQKKKPKPS